jgi:hypothetical protein
VDGKGLGFRFEHKPYYSLGAKAQVRAPRGVVLDLVLLSSSPVVTVTVTVMHTAPPLVPVAVLGVIGVNGSSRRHANAHGCRAAEHNARLCLNGPRGAHTSLD